MAAGRGYIIPVGGAEEKLGDITILRRFAALCGEGSRIAIIPTASEVHDTGARYEALFLSLGVAVARSLPIHTRSDAELPELLQIIEEANGIFLTGGNQLRLSTTLGGTSMAKALIVLMHDRDHGPELAFSARQAVEAGFNRAKNIHQLEDTYLELMK